MDIMMWVIYMTANEQISSMPLEVFLASIQNGLIVS